MSWNNYVEKAKFEREKDKFIKLAKENGMSEENIQEICDYDTAVFHSNRVFYSHNTPLICPKNVENEDYFGGEKKDLINSYSEEMKAFEEGPLWWLNHIENRKLYIAIKKLSLLKLRILDLVAINGYTCEEAGDILGISRSMVSTHLMEIRSLIRPILSDKR